MTKEEFIEKLESTTSEVETFYTIYVKIEGNMENILDDIFNYQVTILKNYLKDRPNQWILTEDFGKRNPILGKFFRDGKEVDGKVKGVFLAPSGNILVYIYDGPEVIEDIEWDAFHDPNIFCLTSDELGDLKHFVINHILDYLDLLL